MEIPPNLFASVMGTGIIAVAATSLPVAFPGRTVLAITFWLLATILLVALSLSALRSRSRRYLDDPVLVHFYGAVPMAVLTVGTATLVAGRHALGPQLAVGIDWVLWPIGTVLGLATAAVVPYLLLTRPALRRGGPFGGWLMPVVPPMVSAAAGALLIQHAPFASALRVGCYCLFAISLALSTVMIALIVRQLIRHGAPTARLVPTLWIVLGPLGQSITAANLLGPRAFGLGYGLPVWAIATGWIAVAATITVRTARRGLPFALTWWSFTFPIGTFVTGTSALAAHTGSMALRWIAALGFVVLVAIWLVVASRTWLDQLPQSQWIGRLQRGRQQLIGPVLVGDRHQPATQRGSAD
jgi:tellurite resistance protein TehA-like permease